MGISLSVIGTKNSFDSFKLYFNHLNKSIKVILDDEDVTKGRENESMAIARARLVRTDGTVGLTEVDATQAIEILKRGGS